MEVQRNWYCAKNAEYEGLAAKLVPGRICGHRATLSERWMRERAMPQHQLRNWQATAEKVHRYCTSTRQALDRLGPKQPIQPVVTRTSTTPACD